jgi:hypothetical protein
MKTTIVIGVIAAFFGVAQATTYAQFCNDNACNDGCGESVSVDNPGCLNENGRQSIKFHVRSSRDACRYMICDADTFQIQDLNLAQVSLVFSPTPNCPCQNYCVDNIL